jgi:hypothetical protein
MTKPVAALIACVKSKRRYPSAAKDLYISSLFCKSKLFADSLGLDVYILSAKHGLIHGNKIVAPYEETLNKKSKADIQLWADKVAAQVSAKFGCDPLMVLAGENYLSFASLIPNQIINPLEGLSIGKRLQWLNQNTKSIAPSR